MNEDLIFLFDTFEAKGKQLYIVGGAVRDLLLGDKPDDYDLATDAVIASSTAAELTGGTRMFGLVASDLLWVQELAALGHPLGTYASGRLSRVEEA